MRIQINKTLLGSKYLMAKIQKSSDDVSMLWVTFASLDADPSPLTPNEFRSNPVQPHWVSS